MKKQQSKSPLNKVCLTLLYLFPVILYFSYYPILLLPLNSDSMHLELSLPLIWLVVFTVISIVLLIKIRRPHNPSKKILFSLLFFPIYLSLSIFWSKNPLRAVLTVGILWCLYISIYAIVVIFTTIKRFDKEKFLKFFLFGSLGVCLFCWLQCILDIFGVPRELTLLCRGCTSQMFGFPHPSGFAIEPQFMGNLLIVPSLLSLYLLFSHNHSPKSTFPKRLSLLLSSVFISTLFLTFSRGAIYSFLVATIFLLIINLIKKNHHYLISLPIIVICFIFTLVSQGVFSQLSYTNDTFLSGIDKTVSQLSLGIINPGFSRPNPGNAEPEPSSDVPEDPGENLSVFSGYVEESTDIRLNLNSLALSAIASPEQAIFGFGLGSAGTILFEQGKIASKLEIIQNEYFSLLLETGILGLTLAALSLVIIIYVVKKSFALPERFLLYSIFLAFLLSLNFFSGLPNALHIYLFTAFVCIMLPRSLHSSRS
ncbi:O-antigen ligase family protein [Candidatus Saccharibacteria bacterium]|nr:O-antigen ligase family protein [Candidatus Saccharibacteria bacterium]